MIPRLVFGPFTTSGTLNDILPVKTSVAQSVEGRGTQSVEGRRTPIFFPCTLFKELSAYKSNLSMIFSKSSRSSFDMEHFSATDVAFHEIRAAWVFKFSFWAPFSLCRILFLHILSIYLVYSVMGG
jgi:hypothetical protein